MPCSVGCNRLFDGIMPRFVAHLKLSSTIHILTSMEHRNPFFVTKQDEVQRIRSFDGSSF